MRWNTATKIYAAILLVGVAYYIYRGQHGEAIYSLSGENSWSRQGQNTGHGFRHK